MTEFPEHIPLSAVEYDTELVRRCLRKWCRQLQRQGEIPPEVSEAELNTGLEQHVPRIVRALHRSPLYPHFKERRSRKQLEAHVRRLLSSP